MLDLLVDSLTGWALVASLLAASIRCYVIKDWSKQAIFFSSSNFASMIVLCVFGVAIWLDGDIAQGVIENSKLVLTYAIIYALWDNCVDFFSRRGKGGMGAD